MQRGGLMNVDDISQLVSNLGFPIVVTGVLFWLMYKNSLMYNNTIQKMRETIDKNTQLIQEMLNQFKEGDK